MSARSVGKRLLAAALAVAALAAIYWTLDRETLAEVLAKTSPAAILVAAALYVPSWLLRGWRWRQIGRDLGDDIPLGPAFAMATVGNMLNLLLPAKAGDLLWVNAAHVRWGIPYGRAFVGVIAGRVLDLLVLSLAGGLALLVVPGALAEHGPLVIGASVACVAAIALGDQLFLARRLGARLLVGPLARLKGLHDALVEPAVMLRGRPGRLALHAGSTLVIWLNEAAVCWVVARGLEIDVGLAPVLFGIMVANLAKIVPLTPASFGTYEAAGAIAFSLAGVGYSAAFAVMLVEHLLKNAVNAALGLAALVLEDIPV